MADPTYASVLRGKQQPYTASLLPARWDEEGKMHWAVPQTLTDTYHAMQHMAEGRMPNDQDAQLLAGAAMLFSGAGGLGSKAVSGRAVEDAAASRPLSSTPVEVGSAPVSARVYRGASLPEQWPPPAGYEDPLRGGKPAFWASDDPNVASAYTRGPEGNIAPADVDFRNPLVVDAKGGRWMHVPLPAHAPKWLGSTGTTTTEHLANWARELGHDGLVVQNVLDEGPSATTYAALKSGTVKSPLTGETLFSNAPEAAPAGLLPMGGDDQTNPTIARFLRQQR